MRKQTYICLVLAFAFISPLLVFRETYRAPLEVIPAARPAPHHIHGDPLIALSVMGRAWNRWDAGDFSRRDDRVFAPYRDAWALGESLTAPSLLGYPFARLAHSEAFGYNIAHYLSSVVAVMGAGFLFSELAGCGWAALLAALVFGWCPGRLNDLGLVQTLWAGFVPLALGFGIRFLSRGRSLHLVGAVVTWLVLGFGSLYSLVMGTTFLATFLLGAVLLERRLFRRVSLLGVGILAASALLMAFYFPLFSAKEEFEVSVSIATIEGYSADLLSVLHQGVFSGPLRSALDLLVPGFPEGAAALFPTLFATLGLLSFVVFRPSRGSRKPRTERSILIWGLVSVVMFVFCLGPVVHLAGHPLFPGPYALLVRLPVFDSMRGVNRWDQFFALSLLAAGAIGLSAVLRAQKGARGPLVASVAILVALVDVWPRRVPALEVPAPSVFGPELESLQRDSVIAYYPFKWSTSVRSWVEQIHHGRRVLNGYQTFPPPIHRWIDRMAASRGAAEVLAVYRELGAAAVEIDMDELPPDRRAEVAALLQRPGERGGGQVRVVGHRALVLWTPREPVLVNPNELGDLEFIDGAADLASRPGRLIFRLGSTSLPVLVRTASGSYEDILTIPVVSAGKAIGRLGRPLPPDATVEDLRSARRIGAGKSR
jgi:hypothetical protein